MEFRILGPLQVWHGRQRIPLGGPQPEKLLAGLLLAGGRVAPLSALIDALWDGEAPPTAKHQVHKLVAALRQRLPGVIETDRPGYRLRIDTMELDAATFAELAAAPTIESLTAALELWRGAALAGIDGRALRTEADLLDERRLSVAEQLAGLKLAAGRAAEVAAELPGLIAEHPLRESLRSLLMVALYRCGRQSDALSVYADIRAELADALGLDPGPELSGLQQQVLRADPALNLPAPKAPCTLPYDVPDFAGRGTDLGRLLVATGAVVINAIDGMAGVGKTALAVHAAHRLAERYPDGQLFCDLHAHTPGARPIDPERALERLLQMLGVPVDAIPDGLEPRSERWRAELAGRKVLVVLDNAASAAQVRPLLPGTPNCLALITSRRRLGAIDGAGVLSLDVLPPTEALALFSNVAGDRWAAAEHQAAVDVVALCGHLPLAIRIAATRLAHRPLWTVSSLRDKLRAQSGRLDQLALEDRGVRAAFGLSYAQLNPEQQRMFRLLGLHPGADFDGYSAAALAQIAPDRAETLMESLVDVHLLLHRSAGRYTFHDLLREYACDLARTEGSEPRARLHDYYLAVTIAAGDLIGREARRFDPTLEHSPRHRPHFQDLDAALNWMVTEHSTLLAVAAASQGWQLACALRAYFEHRGHFADWRATHVRALRCNESDLLGCTLLRFSLGALAMWTDQPAEGMGHFRRVLAGNAGDQPLRAAALTSLGMLAHQLHRDVEAAGFLREALAIDHDSPRLTALGWNNLGLTEGRLGHPRDALRHHRQALALARRTGSATAERGILLGLGETSLRLGLPAEEPFRQALELARTGRFRMQEGLALDGLAHATGETAYWHEALAIFTELGVPRAGLVGRHLADPGVACCELCRGRVPAPRAAEGQNGLRLPTGAAKVN